MTVSWSLNHGTSCHLAASSDFFAWWVGRFPGEWEVMCKGPFYLSSELVQNRFLLFISQTSWRPAQIRDMDKESEQLHSKEDID